MERINLYQLHRPDPATPWEDSVGALLELQTEGKIEMIGISNASIDQIRAAVGVVGEGNLAAVQNQLSPVFRTSEAELRFCAYHGIAFLPWSPLGGMAGAADLGSTTAAFGRVAQARGVTPQQVALAWLLGKAVVVVPIPGSSRPETARASAAAADLTLTADEQESLDLS